MKKYRKWILVLIALTVFYVVHVESLKATSLIHAGKFSKLLNSTSTTTTALPTSSQEPSSDRLREILEDLPDDDVIDVNGTKITLTGIPQIDYVWDPNLPRELNGYNLSSYPFLDSMPADEDIGFDCEDKINGFYASIKYSCQLYHHCLYGVRSDFICANFTAFDQKTFICHFVSEVDCKNSYKYWSRNDDLYKATTPKSTTTSSTLVPLIDRGFYNRTRTSFLNGGHSNSAQQNNNNSPSAASPSQSSNSETPNRSPNGGKNNNRPIVNGNNQDELSQRPLRPLRRPPLYRRRPVDYYYYDDEYTDDFYDERMRRRNRPRNRRPVYDDYDSRRLDNRRPYYDDFDDYEYERRQVRPRNRNEERRRGYDDRRGGGAGERRRPLYDDTDKIDERRRNADRRPQQFSEERKFSSDSDDRRGESRRKNNFEVDDKIVKQEDSVSDEKLIKPQGTSIFDRARPPPKINRPVPLSEKSKYAYNKHTEKAVPAKEDDSYDYYDDPPPSSTTAKITTTTKLITASVTSPKPFFQKIKPATTITTTAKPIVTTSAQEAEYYEDEYYDTVTPTPKNGESTSINSREEQIADSFNSRVHEYYASTTTKSLASSPESFRLNRYKANNGDISRDQLMADQSTRKPQQSIISPNENANNKKYANKQTVFDHVTQETPSKHSQEPLPQQNKFQSLYNNRNLDVKSHQHESSGEEKEQKVLSKIIKRPFLPSRGGNPYKARGLQPVGVLAQQSHDESIPASSEKPKISLDDLYNEEYDVDLNDALNPMLKPLTSSRGIHNSNQAAVSVNKDTQKAQSQIVQHHEKVTESKVSTTEQPEYYDDEFEYSYADEVA